MVGARLLRAHALLRGTTYSLDTVAAHVRFTDSEAMTEAMKWGVGTTPARARDRMGADEFVERLAIQLAPHVHEVPGMRATGEWRLDA
jgi:AraC-like DNA-binding protein